MRAAFSLLALVIVAAIVLQLAKKQAGSLQPPAAAGSAPAQVAQPQAVGGQVQGAVDEAARRTAEAASAATQ